MFEIKWERGLSVPKPLDRIFEVYCHVNATNVELLSTHCKKKDWSYAEPEVYEQQLKTVIQTRSISISDYEKITLEEFNSSDELYSWLTELWDLTIGKPLKKT